MVDVFSLKSQRNSRQNALALDSAKRKTGEKDCCLPYSGDETTTRYDRAFEGNDPVMGFVLGRIVN